MQLLDETAYEAVRPLLTQTISLHAPPAAILAGSLDGEVWADNPTQPAVVLVSDGEASYLAGDPDRLRQPTALRELIPAWTYFLPEANWVPRLSDIWDNPFARPHPRLRFTLERPVAAAPVPAGFELVAIDHAAVARHPALLDFAEDQADGWRSLSDLLDAGIGHAVLREGTVVSHCMPDCVLAGRTELGVGTDEGYRRMGLARAAASAAVEACLARGITDIGWHCHSSNAGSIRIAGAIGMRLQAEYAGFSSNLPAENVGDLSPGQCRDWGLHLEAAANSVNWHGFHAAGAWALAGEHERALSCLVRLVDSGWEGQAEWLEQHWAFAAIRDSKAFRDIAARLTD
jgi:GNAT superfamily N-acetyltransferase